MNITKHKSLLFFLITIFVSLLIQPVLSMPNGLISVEEALTPPDDDEIKAMHTFNPAEMQEMWKKFSSDNGWKSLMKHVATAGYMRSKNVKAMWGFKGKAKTGEDVLFCGYDFYNPKNLKQVMTMIWVKNGDKSYKACMTLPEGAMMPKTLTFDALENSLENAKEWYVDKENNVQVAHSFSRCFARNVRRLCAAMCIVSIAACAATSSSFAVVFGATTGGLGVAAAAGIFASCAGWGCGYCLALCAIDCLDN